MATFPGEVFDAGLDVFGATVDRLDTDDRDRPSPDAGWTEAFVAWTGRAPR